MKKDILLFIIMLCIVGCTNAKTQNENTGTIKPNIIEQKGKEDRFILYANNLDELLEKKEWSIKKLPVLENLNYKKKFSQKELKDSLQKFVKYYHLGKNMNYTRKENLYIAENENYEVIMNDQKNITLIIKNSEKTGVLPRNRKEYMNAVNNIEKKYRQVLDYTLHNLICAQLNDKMYGRVEWYKKGKNDSETVINSYKNKIVMNLFEDKLDMFYFAQYDQEFNESPYYTLKTKEEAIEDMKKGNYISANKDIHIDNREVVYASLTYQNVSNRYVYPCWKLYLKATEKDGLQGFEEIFVPAVYEEELQDYRNELGLLK